MYSFNLIDSFSGSDTFFYILMILLTLIAIALFYLIYTQKKETVKQLKEKSIFTTSQNVEEKKIGSTVKEVESLVPEVTPLVPITEMEIPDPLELTRSINIVNDTMELKNITKELESIPKERKVNMTPYEAEQEEKAIISYDELLNQNKDVIIETGDISSESEVDVNKVLDNVVVTTSYAHEEKVLESLKALLNTLKG